MDVKFMTSIAPIVRDPDTSRSFYVDALGLDFEGHEGDYVFHSRTRRGKALRTLAPLRSGECLLRITQWPAEIPVPQASIEFEVADVSAAATELTAKNYHLIHEARTEPWGQITARLLSPEGLLVAVCFTPAFQDQ